MPATLRFTERAVVNDAKYAFGGDRDLQYAVLCSRAPRGACLRVGVQHARLDLDPAALRLACAALALRVSIVISVPASAGLTASSTYRLQLPCQCFIPPARAELQPRGRSGNAGGRSRADALRQRLPP
jgi:hypothetical protein